MEKAADNRISEIQTIPLTYLQQGKSCNQGRNTVFCATNYMIDDFRKAASALEEEASQYEGSEPPAGLLMFFLYMLILCDRAVIALQVYFEMEEADFKTKLLKVSDCTFKAVAPGIWHLAKKFDVQANIIYLFLGKRSMNFMAINSQLLFCLLHGKVDPPYSWIMDEKRFLFTMRHLNSENFRKAVKDNKQLSMLHEWILWLEVDGNFATSDLWSQMGLVRGSEQEDDGESIQLTSIQTKMKHVHVTTEHENQPRHSIHQHPFDLELGKKRRYNVFESYKNKDASQVKLFWCTNPHCSHVREMPNNVPGYFDGMVFNGMCIDYFRSKRNQAVTYSGAYRKMSAHINKCHGKDNKPPFFDRIYTSNL